MVQWYTLPETKMAPEKWMEVRILLSFWDGQFSEKYVSFMDGSRVVIIPCSFAYNPMFRAPLHLSPMKISTDRTGPRRAVVRRGLHGGAVWRCGRPPSDHETGSYMRCISWLARRRSNLCGVHKSNRQITPWDANRESGDVRQKKLAYASIAGTFEVWQICRSRVLAILLAA